MDERITRRTAAEWLAAWACAPARAWESGREILYNGIRLPEYWPPVRAAVPYEPMECPYLAAPPEVIPIDVGRQLFVDDFPISATNLERVYHQARYHPACPLVKPEHPWESTAKGAVSMVFSDGVWFDPADRLFKMWYMAGYWGSTTMWLDLETSNPQRRYLLFRQRPSGMPTFGLYYSHDGIHWVRKPHAADRSRTAAPCSTIRSARCGCSASRTTIARGCIPVREDATSIEVRWKKAASIAALPNREVRFRFHLRAGDLYSFRT
jgi:hypothetical protein